MPDPVVAAVMRQMRDAIVDADLAIVASINRRIDLAARLRAYRLAHGFPAADEETARWIERYVVEANPGPVSPEDLRRLLAIVQGICEGAP